MRADADSASRRRLLFIIFFRLQSQKAAVRMGYLKTELVKEDSALFSLAVTALAGLGFFNQVAFRRLYLDPSLLLASTSPLHCSRPRLARAAGSGSAAPCRWRVDKRRSRRSGRVARAWAQGHAGAEGASVSFLVCALALAAPALGGI